MKKSLFVFIGVFLLGANLVFGATLYEHLNVGDDISTYSFPPYHRAQTFTPQTDHKISKVRLKLWRKNSPPSPAVVSIKATSGGVPTGSDLCSGGLNVNSLPTSVGTAIWVEISFDSGCDLLADVKYAICLINSGGDSSNKIGWKADGSSPPYTRGSSWEGTGGGGWREASGIDQMFEEYAPLIAVPTGMVTSTLAYIGDVFIAVKTPIFIGIGLPLAFWVIKKLLLFFPR